MTYNYTYSSSPNSFINEYKQIVDEDFRSNYISKQKPHKRKKNDVLMLNIKWKQCLEVVYIWFGDLKCFNAVCSEIYIEKICC